MDLLKNFNFVIIHIIRKMLVLLENHLYNLKDNVFKWFSKKYSRLLFFFKKLFFLKYMIRESLSPEEENIIKDLRNLFRLKKEIKEIKDMVLRNIKNLFTYEKEEENYYKPVRLNNFG